MNNILNYRIILSFVILLTLIIYSNTLEAPFIYDDIPNIVNNPATKDLSFFSHPTKVFDPVFSEAIRPFFVNRYLGYLTFAINYKQTGLDTISYHVTNIIIHIINVILVFLLIKLTISKTSFGHRLNISEDKSEYFAIIVAALFAVHPIQTQSVTYIVQRFASLATLFYLLSLVLYIYWRINYSDLKRPLFYMLALLSTICAMKTKEITFTLPIMMLLYDIVFIKDKFKNTIVYLLPFIFCMTIIPLTLISLSGLQDGLNTSNHFNVSMWQYLFTQFTVIVKYISLLLLPINQAVDYAYPLYKSFFETRVVLSFLLLTVLFLFGLYMTFNNNINPFLKISGFGILWFIITLSVESSIIPIADYIYEHRLYLPSLGFFISIVSVLYMFYIKCNLRLQEFLLIFFVSITIVLGYATYNRNEVWLSEETLWKDNINKQSLKARAYTNLSNYYYKKSDTQKAVDVLEEGFKLISDDFFLYNNLSVAYTANGNYEKAEALLSEMLVKFPDNKSWTYTRYGYLYLDQNQLNKAYEMFLMALKNGYSAYDIWLNLSKILLKQGHYERALFFSKVSLMNKPNDIETLSLTAVLLEKMNRFKEAHHYYRQMLMVDPEFLNNLIQSGVNKLMSNRLNEARNNLLLSTKLDPTSSEAYYFLGLSEFRLNNLDEAKAAFVKSIELNTEYLHYAHFFLTKIYQKQGDTQSAIEHIKKSIEAKPDFELAKNTLRDLEPHR